MKISECLVIVRGGGDLATGTIFMLHQCGFKVLVLEIEQPTTIRRQAAFSEAMYQESVCVEGVTARKVCDLSGIEACHDRKEIPVIADPDGLWIVRLQPEVVVDAMIAKKNMGTHMSMAPLVIALGPGFCAGTDAHIVIETMRGHDLGRLVMCGSAAKNTGVPGNVGGYTSERVIHAPAGGLMINVAKIGDIVTKGQLIARVGDHKVTATLDGVLRGLLKEGLKVPEGFKIADIDPRIAEQKNCVTISDKARTIGGGVLQAIFMHGRVNEI